MFTDDERDLLRRRALRGWHDAKALTDRSTAPSSMPPLRWWPGLTSQEARRSLRRKPPY